MRSLSTLATLLLGLAVVFWAPAANADCPHNGNDTHQHCSGEPSTNEMILNLLEPKTIFVTSLTYTGDLGGLAGADTICQGLADAPGSIVPDGEYVALLSTDDVAAAARITPSSGPYIRPDGAPVAAGFATLFHTANVSGRLIFIPNINEMGDEQGGNVWTGTRPFGIAFETLNCLGWLSADDPFPTAEFGVPTAMDAAWLAAGTSGCGSSFSIYCVQR